MPSRINSDKTPKWRNDIHDLLRDLQEMVEQGASAIIISADEAQLLIEEISQLQNNRCPICKNKVCQYEVICSKCFAERQGSS